MRTMRNSISFNVKLKGALLSTILADEVTLYIKTRKSYWNVNLMERENMHGLLEEQCRQIDEFIASLAKRIGELGQPIIGTMSEFCRLTVLKESPGRYFNAVDSMKELLEDHAEVIHAINNGIEGCAERRFDESTMLFLEELKLEHEAITVSLREVVTCEVITA